MRTLIVFLAFVVSSVGLAKTAPKSKPLLAQIAKNGSMVIRDGSETIAIVEPCLFSPGWKDVYYFTGVETTGPGGLKGEASLSNGATVRLEGAISQVKDGLKVEYGLTNSAPLTVQEIAASVKLNRDNWLGAKDQVGLYPSRITSTPASAFKAQQQCLALLGPSQNHGSLYMVVNGDDSLAALINDNGEGPKNCLEIRLDTDKEKGFKWNSLRKDTNPLSWDAGDKKTITFTLTFNRPLKLSRSLLDPAFLPEERQNMAENYIPFPTPKPTQSPTPDPFVETDPGYEIPGDANVVDYHLSRKFGDHLLVPVEFWINDKNYSGWLAWDTGIRPNNCDIQVTGDFFHQAGFAPQTQRTTTSGLGVGPNGAPTTETIKFNYVANDKFSDVGPVNIHMKMGNLEVPNIRFYTDPTIDRASSDRYNDADPFFSGGKNGKVLGNVVFPFMQGFIFSIDYKNRKIYLRPIHADRRRFFKEEPLAVIDGVMPDGIFCPVSVDGKPRGYGEFDTGDPVDIFDLSSFGASSLPFTSVKLGGYDVLNQNPGYQDAFFKKIGFYSKKNLNIIMLIGNDSFKDRFITVDPLEQKIYIEK